MNVFRLRNGTVRFALALLLALVTQLAMAGELCRAVEAGIAEGGMPKAVHPASRVAGDKAASGLPCCEHAPSALVKCARAEPTTTRVALGKFHLSNALPSFEAFPALQFDGPRLATHLAGHSAGPPIPPYILFGRFLS